MVGGTSARLTVAKAATLATRPAVAALAEPPENQVTLPGLRVSGLPFPYWEDRFDWRAAGARTDHLAGRVATTVFYRRGAQRVAYTIVSGQPLAAPASHAALSIAGRQVVTWLRRGNTCVLSGRGVPVAELVRLAAWRGHGRIPY